MKKRLHTDAISNELKGASLFFTRSPAPPAAHPAPIVPEVPEPPIPSAPTAPPEGSVDHAPGARTPRPARSPRTTPAPTKRHMIRHAFEIYHDQYESLVRLAAEERMEGGVGSMSQMVREALDRLIAERHGE